MNSVGMTPEHTWVSKCFCANKALVKLYFSLFWPSTFCLCWQFFLWHFLRCCSVKINSILFKPIFSNLALIWTHLWSYIKKYWPVTGVNWANVQLGLSMFSSVFFCFLLLWKIEFTVKIRFKMSSVQFCFICFFLSQI
jgi:hypothetical protein